MIGLQTQRGCRLRCVYCAYPHIEGRSVRPFDVEAVAAEARALEALGARFLILTDAVFNGAAEHALAVAGALRRAGLSIPWGGFFAPLVRARRVAVESGHGADELLGSLRKPGA